MKYEILFVNTKINDKENKGREYVEYILVLFSILLSKSLYYETYGQNNLLIPFLILTLIILLFLIKRRLRAFSRTSIIYLLILLLSVIGNPHLAFNSFMVFISLTTIAALFVSIMPFDNYADKFYSIMKIIMVLSLFRYIPIVFHLTTPFPPFFSIIGDQYQNFVIFSIYDEPGIYLNIIRNNSLWWEAGAFQLFVNFAFIFGIIRNRVTTKGYIFFLIVIISTASTTGLTVFAVLTLTFILNKKKSKLFIMLFSFLIVSIFFTEYFSITISSKTDVRHGSTMSRLNDIALGSRIFYDNPILGIGFGNIETLEKYKREYAYGTGSNTIFVFLAYLGLMSASIFYPILNIRFLKYIGTSRKLLIQLSIFGLIMGTNMSIILLFYLVLFYSIIPYIQTEHMSPKT